MSDTLCLRELRRLNDAVDSLPLTLRLGDRRLDQAQHPLKRLIDLIRQGLTFRLLSRRADGLQRAERVGLMGDVVRNEPGQQALQRQAPNGGLHQQRNGLVGKIVLGHPHLSCVSQPGEDAESAGRETAPPTTRPEAGQ
ncbi:hypothetical protein [Brevundimonas sp.]|uniref:hypothetical protein n=1 Tax=Brevundimonas sp. TaxID=1871086 RepID=UPI00257B4031|nr:hypothetical protein [Brevundimonas sp.]